jgi:hypothetical protein
MTRAPARGAQSTQRKRFTWSQEAGNLVCVVGPHTLRRGAGAGVTNNANPHKSAAAGAIRRQARRNRNSTNKWRGGVPPDGIIIAPAERNVIKVIRGMIASARDPFHSATGTR